MVNGSCRVVVFSPPMATAVFGGLTHATPGDVLSSHRASELTGSGGCPCASTYGGDATRERVKGICRHDLAHYGRAKTSARLVGTPLVMLPDAPGLSHSSPADNCYIGVRLDWVIHQHGYWRPTRVGGGSDNVPPAFTWDAESYIAGSLKTCVPIEPV
jgi:hypothetical protein